MMHGQQNIKYCTVYGLVAFDAAQLVSLCL